MNLDDPELELYRRALDRLALPRFAARESCGPTIVALEGANGSGKSTLCRALAGSLGALRCLGTDEAWFAEPFKVRMIRDAEWPASAMFFLSGCLEQMRVLRERSEPLVIMDRCLWSTLAVHAATSVDRIEALLAMLSPVAREIRVPDLTIVLDASFATCQARIARKTGTARALDELTAKPAFHARERAFYRWLIRQQPGVKFLQVDRSNPEEVAAAATTLVQEFAPC
jgi:thymidylate kinase